jgi:hypothetical protein
MPVRIIAKQECLKRTIQQSAVVMAAALRFRCSFFAILPPSSSSSISSLATASCHLCQSRFSKIEKQKIISFALLLANFSCIHNKKNKSVRMQNASNKTDVLRDTTTPAR